MKTTKNPWLEERGALYKLFYYLGPCLLIIAFLLLWQGIASGGKTMLPIWSAWSLSGPAILPSIP